MALGKLGGGGFGHLGGPLGGAGGYNPVAALGTDLIAYWDARRSDLITIATGVSSWKDIVAGYDATQATGANQPTYSATSFNGDAALSFDGVNHSLTSTTPALLSALPTGSTPCELWALFSQEALVGDATGRDIVSYGSSGSFLDCRMIGRVVTGGANRARGYTGDGAAVQARTGTNVDLSSRHVMRWVVGSTSSTLTIDGISEGTLSVIPSTVAARFRIGAAPGSSSISLHQGKIAVIMVTKALSTGEAAALQNYLLQRRLL